MVILTAYKWWDDCWFGARWFGYLGSLKMKGILTKWNGPPSVENHQNPWPLYLFPTPSNEKAMKRPFGRGITQVRGLNKIMVILTTYKSWDDPPSIETPSNAALTPRRCFCQRMRICRHEHQNAVHRGQVQSQSLPSAWRMGDQRLVRWWYIWGPLKNQPPYSIGYIIGYIHENWISIGVQTLYL